MRARVWAVRVVVGVDLVAVVVGIAVVGRCPGTVEAAAQREIGRDFVQRNVIALQVCWVDQHELKTGEIMGLRGGSSGETR